MPRLPLLVPHPSPWCIVELCLLVGAQVRVGKARGYVDLGGFKHDSKDWLGVPDWLEGLGAVRLLDEAATQALGDALAGIGGGS